MADPILAISASKCRLLERATDLQCYILIAIMCKCGT